MPVHAPLATHDVALSDDHVNTVVAPLVTVVGLADSVTVGAAAPLTVTVTDWLADPPSPVQVKV